MEKPKPELRGWPTLGKRKKEIISDYHAKDKERMKSYRKKNSVEQKTKQKKRDREYQKTKYMNRKPYHAVQKVGL